MGEDSAAPRSGQRVTVDKAARHLGLSVDAIRKRVQRGQIAHEKDAAGRVRIILDESETLQDEGRTTPDNTTALISEMREHIEDLREQLEAERQAHAEARELLLSALTKIPPAIEARESPASRGPGDTPETSTDAGDNRQEPSERRWWEFWR